MLRAHEYDLTSPADRTNLSAPDIEQQLLRQFIRIFLGNEQAVEARLSTPISEDNNEKLMQ